MSLTALTRRRPATTGAFDRKLLAPMILGAILNPVNSSVVAVALVPISIAFGAPASTTAWLVAALYLATAVGQPVVGTLIDSYGPRRLFLIATTLVGLAGAIGALAPNIGTLIAARALLGLGTCAGYPAAMYLIRSEAQRTGEDSPAPVLTILAVSTQTVAVIGPSLGGLLIGLGGWRTTLAINVPVAIIAFLLARRRLPRPTERLTHPHLDHIGILLFAATLITLLLGLMHPALANWPLYVGAIVGGILFTAWELRHRGPFIDLRLLAGNTPLLRTYARTLLAYFVSYCMLYGYTQWLEGSRGLTASQTGLLQLPLFCAGIVVSIIAGRRKPVRGKLLLGAGFQVLACVALLFVGVSTPIVGLVLIALLFGVPQGLNSLAFQNSVYYQAPADRIAASAGLLRTFTYLGAIIASTTQGAVFGHGPTTSGLHILTLCMLVTALCFLVITVFDRSLVHCGRTNNSAPQGKDDTTMSASDQSTVDPAKTALLVMDYQHGILGLLEDQKPLLDNAKRAIDAAREAGTQIGYVRVAFTDEDFDAMPATGSMAAAIPQERRPMLHADAPSTAIHEQISPQDNDIVVRKTRVGAFSTTDLGEQLHTRGIDTLVLAGISTSGVVLSTVRAAADEDYRILVLSDACADPDTQVHETLMGKVLPRQARVVTTDEFVSSLN